MGSVPRAGAELTSVLGLLDLLSVNSFSSLKVPHSLRLQII